MNLVQHFASRLDGRRVAALRMRALGRMQDRNWEDAERAWREVLSVAPNSLDGAVELTEVLRRLKRYAEADQLLRPFLHSAPRDLRVLVVHARTATAAADNKAALKRWRTVL